MKLDKTTFSIIEFKEEVQYLEAKAEEGLMLEQFDGNGYHFCQNEPAKLNFEVAYTIEPMNDDLKKQYLDQGFILICTYTSEKGGAYYYFARPRSNEPIISFNEDRSEVIKMMVHRIERFTGIVIGSLLVLFIYLYLNYRNNLYFIIIGAGGVLAVYTYQLRRKAKAVLEEISK
ncbi:DUF2812 domain-containing protein [Erysipelothrix rhusiopathiae]|nr:DUF2812 domain-containing protein [Erysipelothrix rhusiopathiae]MDE8319220.1 DUF2812 domain-containing protein [Erysipelothrix rhusiopathiae]MDE8330953.1 DUF2812 domain-containing protein [Erysipelothrix rhusiopathiae]